MLSHRFELELGLVELLEEVAVVQGLVEDHLLQADGEPLQVREDVPQRVLNLK